MTAVSEQQKIELASPLTGCHGHHAHMTSYGDPIGPKSFKRMRAVQAKMRRAKTHVERLQIAEELHGTGTSAWDEELDRKPRSVADIPTGIRGQSKRAR